MKNIKHEYEFLGMKNAFGMEIYSIGDLLKDNKTKELVHKTLINVLRIVGTDPKRYDHIVKHCIETTGKTNNHDYERNIHQIMEREGIPLKIERMLTNRAETIYNQVKPFLIEGSVLDFGCGDGKVGEIISRRPEHHRIALTDIYEHSYVKETGLEFRLFKDGDECPFKDNEFDNTLAITVFHHCKDPLAAVKNVCRMTRMDGRALVIESVFGVKWQSLSSNNIKGIEDYMSLTKEQQRKVNMFFDHFYNRILHYNEDVEKKVNVPFNFNTPEGWKSVFEENGFEQEQLIGLGVDQPMVPEYHTLHVLRKVC